MRTFESFNGSNGDVCPVCKTAANIETVLVPIPGTEDGNNVEAAQVHKKCYDLFLEMGSMWDKDRANKGLSWPKSKLFKDN